MPHLKGEGAGDLLATVDVRLPHPVPKEPPRLGGGTAGSTRLKLRGYETVSGCSRVLREIVQKSAEQVDAMTSMLRTP